MDVGSPVDKEADISKKIISPQLQTEIPKWVANNARFLHKSTITSHSCHFFKPKQHKLVIVLDGAHLNGKLGGVMLTSTELRKRIPDMCGLTFISDRMKGILESVKRLFPLANHRYCLRHLYKNFLTKGFRNPRLTQLLWQASKAYKYKHWEVSNVFMIFDYNECAFFLVK
ncbi:hypothetical protein MKW92_043488 [Papaver armeniacum]|nr:hypothetical protein MKW92_043488 [Papaver armeniacum]